MKLIIPTTAILRNLTGDDSALSKYISNLLTTGAIDFNSRIDNNTIFIINQSVFEPSQIELESIISSGGEVEQFPMVLKIPLALMGNEVDNSLPDELLYNNGTEVLTYSNWFSANDRYVNNDYVYCVTATTRGTLLTGTQILYILGLSNSVELLNITSEEFTNIL